MLPIVLCLLIVLPAALAQGGGDGAHSPVIEIEFQSLGPHGGPGREELRSMLAGGSSQGENPGDDLGALFSQLLALPAQRPSRRQRPGGLRSPLLGAGAGFSLDPAAARFAAGFGGPPPGADHVGSFTIQRSSRLPLSMFNDLFPVPMTLLPDDDDDEVNEDNLFGPDMLVANMMQHLSDSFKKDMLPAIRRQAAGGGGAGSPARGTHEACADDLKALRCNATQSRLQCLGQHADRTSEACRKDVGKSVPFLCGSSIEQLCDVLERGILPCLADHLQELDEGCRDAVVATHGVIARANTQKASLRDPETGDEKAVHLPGGAFPAAEVSGADLLARPGEVKQKPTPALMTLTDASPGALQHVSFDQAFAAPKDATRASGQSSAMSAFDMAAVVTAVLVVGFFIKTSFIDRKGKPTGGSLLELGGGEADGKHML